MKSKILVRSSLAVGGYLLYFLLGFPLIHLGYVERWPIFPATYLKFNQPGASKLDDDQSVASPDAPHLFYRADSVMMHQVRLVDSTLTNQTNVFPLRDRSKLTVECTFAEQPHWRFSTQLKDSLRVEPTTYAPAEQLLVLSDIEGNFMALRGLLLTNGVIDTDYNWTFGQGHVVVLGDVFDRGVHVTECLWLLYKLEQNAEKQGGKLHFILGNHDLMNLSGDLRYVRKKYLQNDSLMGVPYEQWYTPHTELGRWVATKNSVERIGDWLFAHGGVSAAVARLGLSPEAINDTCRRHYFDALDARNQSKRIGLLFGPDGPHWYRGYVQEEASGADVSKVLKWAKCTRMVVAHTIVRSVRSGYDNRVFLVDTPHAQGISEALLITSQGVYRTTSTGKRTPL